MRATASVRSEAIDNNAPAPDPTPGQHLHAIANLGVQSWVFWQASWSRGEEWPLVTRDSLADNLHHGFVFDRDEMQTNCGLPPPREPGDLGRSRRRIARLRHRARGGARRGPGPRHGAALGPATLVSVTAAFGARARSSPPDLPRASRARHTKATLNERQAAARSEV